jgi:hypothetical protein
MTMAGKGVRVLVTPTSDLGKILACMHGKLPINPQIPPLLEWLIARTSAEVVDLVVVSLRSQRVSSLSKARIYNALALWTALGHSMSAFGLTFLLREL